MLDYSALLNIAMFMVEVSPVSPATDDWGSILATYGLAAPFILFLLYAIREQRKDIKEKDNRIETLTNVMADRVIPLITEANSVLKESADILKESHQSTRSLMASYEQLDRNISRLEELARKWENS